MLFWVCALHLPRAHYSLYRLYTVAGKQLWPNQVVALLLALLKYKSEHWYIRACVSLTSLVSIYSMLHTLSILAASGTPLEFKCCKLFMNSSQSAILDCTNPHAYIFSSRSKCKSSNLATLILFQRPSICVFSLQTMLLHQIALSRRSACLALQANTCCL